MPRTIRDAKLETRAARGRLTPSRKPHFKTLVPGELALGYRRKRADEPGQWLVRRYIGGERYRIVTLGPADDFQDAGPTARVLTYAEAQRRALADVLARPGSPQPPGPPLTLGQAMKDYLQWLTTNRATARRRSPSRQADSADARQGQGR
jgi:hypothetical protein